MYKLSLYIIFLYFTNYMCLVFFSPFSSYIFTFIQSSFYKEQQQQRQQRV